MKLQKQLSKRTSKKDYPKYVVVIPTKHIEKAGFKGGDDLEVESKKGEIKVRRK